MGEWDELLGIFLTESKEHLSDIETDLLSIETSGADIDEDLVNKVFRAAHSIKGGAGFFDLSKIQELGHKTENVLEMIRSRQITPTPDVVNILLLSFDKLRDMINNHEESNTVDIAEFVVSLTGLTESHLPPEEKQTVSETVEIPLPDGRNVIAVSHFDLDRAVKSGKGVYLVGYDMIDDIQRMNKTPLDVLNHLASTGLILGCVLDIESVGTLDDEETDRIPFFTLYANEKSPSEIAEFLQVPEDKIYEFHHELGEESAVADTVVAESPVEPEPEPVVYAAPEPVAELTVANERIEPEPEAASSQVGSQRKDTAPGQSETSLRVSVNLLESLMNLAGELVLSRNQLVEAITRVDTRLIQASGQRINLVTSELQETIMLTRMQPVGNVLNKFPRVIRDMSRELKKDIQLNISGKEVEMDKTIIEGLSDPLTHLVRNAVDHGVEMPEVRRRNGKNPTGTVNINVYHEAGHVVIEIGDDGKGIDPDKVAQAAVAKGMVTQEQVRTMSENEMMFLIFQPGLSTAEKITDVSGRGVGMDVVKTNLDRLGGKVEIESELGKGSIIRIKLPLTLAIIPSLLISIEEERFAIPQVNVREMIHVGAEQVKEKIEIVGDAEVLVLRGELIPIVNLADVLALETTYDSEESVRKPSRRENIADRRSARHPGPNDPQESDAGSQSQSIHQQERRSSEGRRYHAGSDLNIVVVTAGALQYGLVVEELHDTVEIVVKPLGRHLKGSHEYAGATIMGDGRVALILDVSGIADKANLTSMSGSARAAELAEQARRDKFVDVQSFLVFSNADREQCAVPLDLVARVEQVDGLQVENLGGKRTMQYRGASLPLVALSDAASVNQLDDERDLVVIVSEISGREIGLLASMPVDVVEARVTIDQSTLKQTGVIGSTIIGDRTTLIVDMFELVQSAHPEWIGEVKRAVSTETGTAATATTILLAEDSDFFRAQVKKYLTDDGFEVIDAPDGQAAWEALQSNADEIEMVVTDIEMPRLDGLGLAQKIRSDPGFSKIPIMALTSLAGEDDMMRGKAVGIDDYQVKLDRENLLNGIRRLMNNLAVAA